MLVTEEQNNIANPAEVSVANLETRFSIAGDALSRGKSHADEAAQQFLDSLYNSLADFRLDDAAKEPLDERVVSVLTRMTPVRNFFLEFVDLAVNSERSAAMHVEIRKFLGRSLAYKHAPRDIIHFNYLWCDHYRFFLREIFLSVIAVLLANRDYDEINRYLDANYLFETDRGPQVVNFLSFDAYVKSLDEFRMRRLGQSRLSAAADFQKERADLAHVSFDDIMQADFLLSVRGLLHHPKALARWFPRTLVFAERFEKPGFDLFFSAQSKQKFQSVCVVLNVRNKADLLQRFAQVSKECALSEWKFGGVAIPFEGYLGLAALDTA